MRQIPVIIHIDKMEISEYWRKVLRQAVKDNGKPIRAIIDPLMPESRNQRKYLHGCLLPLLVYLDGNDYRDSEILEHYFENYKREFSPELIKINGKIHTFGKSTKGSKALLKFISTLQDYIVDNYGISYDNKAMSTDSYKYWRDVLLTEDYNDYISYCVAMKFIP
jgi:hypothetical protein